MMMMTTAPVGLIVLLLTFHSFNTISARTRTCRSSIGRTTQCEEDQSCCETNGRATCCSGSISWWVWLVIVFCVVVLPITCAIACVCLFWSLKRRDDARHARNVQPMRRFEPSTERGFSSQHMSGTETAYPNNNNTVHLISFTRLETSLNNTETNTSTDVPPSYSDVSQSSPSTGSGTIHITTVETSLNNTETNTSTDAPPSYSDVSKTSEQLPPPYPRIL